MESVNILNSLSAIFSSIVVLLLSIASTISVSGRLSYDEKTQNSGLMFPAVTIPAPLSAFTLLAAGRASVDRQRYTHLTAFFPGYLVSRHQKGKTILDFNEARDDREGSGISWIICKSFAPYSRQITMPSPHRSILYRLDTLPDIQPTVSKH